MNYFKSNVSYVLRELIRKKGLSVSELARRTSIPQPTIYRIVQGEHQRPHKKTLLTLSGFFNVTIEQLMGLEPIGISTINKGLVSQLPILDYKQVVTWPQIISDVTEYIVFDKQISDNSFAIRVQDKSMEPLITKHSLLIVDPERVPGYRSLVVVKLHDFEVVVVRQFIKDAGKCYIRPLSQDFDHFKMTILTAEDSIKGTVIEARLSYEEL